MKRLSFASLRVKLIVLALMAITPALGITLYSGLEQRESARHKALNDAFHLTQEISKDHDRLIQNTRQVLFTLSQMPQVYQQDKAACCRIFSNLMRQFEGYTALLAVKPNGDVFASNQPLTKPVNFSDRPWFQRLLKTRDFIIGEYVIGRATGKPTVVLAFPVLDDKGHIKAILAVGLDLEWLKKTVTEIKFPEGTSVSVIDSDGTILLRHPESEKFAGKSMPEASIVKAIMEKREGVKEEVGLDGVLRLFGFTSLGKGVESIHVSVGIPRQIALADADRVMRNSLAILVLIAGLALPAAWFVGGFFIRRPINRLLDNTKQLADGNLTARSGSPYGQGEIGQLAYAFDQMAESLEQREADRKQAEETLRRSEEETKRLAKEAAILAEVGRIISSTLNIEDVYEHFAGEVHKLIPFDRVTITVINSDEETVTMVYIAGLEVPSRRAGNVFPLAGSATGEVLGLRSGLLIEGEAMEEFVKRLPGFLPTYQAGIRSTMVVPLISRDQIIGVLLLSSTQPNSYTERDLKLAERIGNQIAGAIAIAQLFSEHERAEKALRESTERYRNVLDNVEEGYYEVDLRGNFTFFSDSLCKIFGYSREELTGMNNRQYMDKETAKMVYQTFNQVYTTGEPNRGVNWEVIRKDGTKRIHESSVSLIKDAKGESVGFRGIARDVTERKKAEKEKRSLEEQFRQSQKMEAIGQLVGGIAHDFNNLLTIMKTYSQLSLMDLKEGDRFRETFEAIDNATTKSANLVRQLLAFSRRQVMEVIVIDLNNLLRGLEKMLRRIIGEDIELLTVLADDLGRVKADPGQIEQVVFNLAVNARDAMPKGGKLTIETANVELDEAYARSHVAVTPGRYVMIAASDTGVGMTPEIKERVFEPFFTTKEKGKGTGLGLSTVYGIVKQSGGNIWIYSEPGQGATFKIYLPRVEELLTEEKEKEESGLFRGVGVILVVEDEEMVRKVVLEVLRKQGYSVLEAADEEDALLICQQYKDTIHLMVTDVVMPKISGPELAKRLVAFHPEMKVLYMSGYTDDAIVHHGVLDKGVNYIQKPFTYDGLARKVRKVLEKDTKPAI